MCVNLASDSRNRMESQRKTRRWSNHLQFSPTQYPKLRLQYIRDFYEEWWNNIFTINTNWQNAHKQKQIKKIHK